MSRSAQLNVESCLLDLNLQDFQVSPTTLTQVVLNQFDQRPDLAGVIIANPQRFVGTISRRLFYEHLSESLSLEKLLKNPIQYFFNEMRIKGKPLQLSYLEKIGTAVSLALARDRQMVYEPIVVTFAEAAVPGICAYFLLDFQTLILAQSKILSDLNLDIEQKQMESQQNTLKLERQNQKVEAYARLLEDQLATIHERNQLLEFQQKELVRKNEEVAEFNHRFIEIGRILSQSGKRAFRATFSGVNVICSQTDKIVETGDLLEEELKTIDDTSKLIERVSQQVRHLAVQLAIIANQMSSEMRGFSSISSEISQLVTQTFEAGQQMKRVSNRFRQRIQDFTEYAQTGNQVATSLVDKIERAQTALGDLEVLVKFQANKSTPQLPPSLAQKKAKRMKEESTEAEVKESTNGDIPTLEAINHAPKSQSAEG
ncbi:hypothetical protein [Roseofilum casamattae]|uniref:Methyl-accepting transducer domain-containing protein n=1 Tax=Roseofilum casamattae BLCC-M143 TaxID=3022442 RepID=A0ABT7BTL1_9CYAN|nr:hypothetical protein [Roseofilum casamattae]MDJ1182523.1 hypothetical protein [Roseofilum casamattae BLCC-M143]